MKIKLLEKWPGNMVETRGFTTEFDTFFKESFRFKGERLDFKDNKIIGDMDNGISIPHVMMYFYRRFGAIQGGGYKTCFDMLFDVGKMYLGVHGSYLNHIFFRLYYKSNEAYIADSKDYWDKVAASREQSGKWLLEHGKVSVFDLSGSKDQWAQWAREGVEKLWSEFSVPDGTDIDTASKLFWEEVIVKEYGDNRDKFLDDEPDFGFPTATPEMFPMAYKNAQEVVRNFLRPVWVRDVYFNIQGYDMGKGREVPCHKNFND